MDILLRALRYPAQYSVLLAIVVYVLFMALAEAARLFGIALWWFTSVAAVTYTCVLFKGCANGRNEAPAVSANEANIFGSGRLWPVLGFYAVAAMIAWNIGDVEPRGLRWSLAAVWGFAFPAGLALAVLNESFWDGTDLAKIADVITELGLHYLLMPLAALIAAVTLDLIALLPVPGLLRSFAAGYIVIATLAFWGFTLNAHADAIGLEPTNDDTFRRYMDERDALRSENTILDSAYAEANTDSAKACATLNRLFEGDGDTLEHREAIFERIRDWPAELVPLRLAQNLIERYLALGNDARVLELVAYGLGRNPAFRPAQAAHTLKVAALAQKHQEYATVVQLLSDFAQRFPEHPQRVAAAIGGAGVALGRLGDKALARQLFAPVATLPQARRHPRFAELEKALGFDAVAPTSGAAKNSSKPPEAPGDAT